jgi:hypothetical protein
MSSALSVQLQVGGTPLTQLIKGVSESQIQSSALQAGTISLQT